MTVIRSDELADFMRHAGLDQWGVAACPPLPWPHAPALPFAISVAIRIEPSIIAEVEHGPTPAYFAEYTRLNLKLGVTTDALAVFLDDRGAAAQPVQATGSPDPTATDWADARVFAHKTAATQAGLGWIGKTALFVSPHLGPRLRLATVFTDAELPVGDPVNASRCGSCRRCLDACPAGAGHDVLWSAGMPRDELLDVSACERQNNSNVGDLGELCGICVAVCPFGRKQRGA